MAKCIYWAYFFEQNPFGSNQLYNIIFAFLLTISTKNKLFKYALVNYSFLSSLSKDSSIKIAEN